MSRLFRALENWNASPRVKVATVVGGVIALSTYQVFSGGSRNNKSGHHYMSSEKPQALRGETERDLEVERARMARVAPTAATAAVVAAEPSSSPTA